MSLRNLLAAFAVLIMAGGLPLAARAAVDIKVDQGIVEPLPVAVPAFSGAGRGAEMAQVITGDLERSGLFAPIAPGAYPERNLDIAVQPRFEALGREEARSVLGIVVQDIGAE